MLDSTKMPSEKTEKEALVEAFENLLNDPKIMEHAWDGLKNHVMNQFKYGDMYLKLPLPVEKIEVDLTSTDPNLRPPLFYYGFESCMAGATDPHQEFYNVTGKVSTPGPDWGTFVEGWEMCTILRDKTDRGGVPLVKQEIAIIFDLKKMSVSHVMGLHSYISKLSTVNDENWEEASWPIEDYVLNGKGSGNNYWLVCRHKRWTGNLLKWLIEDKFPDSSYRVVPNPNL